MQKVDMIDADCSHIQDILDVYLEDGWKLQFAPTYLGDDNILLVFEKPDPPTPTTFSDPEDPPVPYVTIDSRSSLD